MRFWALTLLLMVMPATGWSRIPPLQEVQQESLRYSGYDHQEIREWKKKSKWSAALPRFQVGFDRQLKDIVKLTTRDNVSVSDGNVFVGPNENNFDQDTQQGLGVDVRAVWYLNELVFNEDRIEVSRETRNWLEDRGRLLERVTDFYYRWKRERNRSRKEEWAGYLDAYTGGWFSREWGRKG